MHASTQPLWNPNLLSFPPVLSFFSLSLSLTLSLSLSLSPSTSYLLSSISIPVILSHQPPLLLISPTYTLCHTISPARSLSPTRVTFPFSEIPRPKPNMSMTECSNQAAPSQWCVCLSAWVWFSSHANLVLCSIFHLSAFVCMSVYVCLCVCPAVCMSLRAFCHEVVCSGLPTCVSFWQSLMFVITRETFTLWIILP